MIRHITSLILAPRKENLLIICLVLGFIIMVTGSWLNSRHSDMAQDTTPDQWETPSPAGYDFKAEDAGRIYASYP
ncbi:MAG: hypothetical protein K9I85_05340 [Saprospiraceae bacterium]|nr:hypothetical protein [Saprospiraceae bacterium]